MPFTSLTLPPLRLLTLCIAILIPALVQASDQTPWQRLSDLDRQLYQDVVSSARKQGFEAKEDYNLHYHMAEASASDDVPTSRTVLQRRFLELELALSFKKANIRQGLEQPGETELREFAKTLRTIFPPRRLVSFQVISLYVLSDTEANDVEARAREARSRVDQGEDFGDIVHLYSDARSRSFDGNSADVPIDAVAPAIGEILSQLKVEEVRGPVRDQTGFHIYKLTAIRDPYDSDNPEHRALALRHFLDRRVNEAFSKEVLRSTEKIPLHIQPLPSEGESPCLFCPYIIANNGVFAPYGVVWALNVQSNLNMTFEGVDRAMLEEEAIFLRPWVEEGIAILNSGMLCDPQYQRALEMALAVQKGENHLRDWYTRYKASEEEIQAEYEALLESDESGRTYYTARIFHLPLDLESAKSGAEVKNLFISSLRALQGILEEQNDQSPDEIFNYLTQNLPAGRVTRIEESFAVSPFVDPYLRRTEEGKFSRPFDTDRGVAILFVEKKETRPWRLDEVDQTMADRARFKAMKEFMKQSQQ